MSLLKIAMVGCGGINSKHADHLITLPDQVELTAFVDNNLDKAVGMAQKYGVRSARVFSDFSEMMTTSKPDAIVVAIPPFAHRDEVKIAARMGTHVFIEKPIALTSEKAEEMVAEAEQAGIKTQVGFMYRFGAAVVRIKKLIDSGKSGPLGLVTARYFCNSLHSEWWRDRSRSGGQVFEQAIHMVDLMRFLLGDAVTAYSLQNNLFHRAVPDYTVEDVSGTVFGFKNGGIGVLTATNGAIPGLWEYDLRVVTQKVTAFLADANHATITFTDHASLAVEEITSDQDVYAMEMDDFLKAIKEGCVTQIPIREGARTLDMVAAAARSAQTHAEINI